MTQKLKVTPMLKEVFRNVMHKSSTLKYPMKKRAPPAGFRGRQVFSIDLCISCGLCARDCPSKAIEMVDFEGKKRPIFYLDRCIFCYQCAESCPRNAIKTSTFFELASSGKSDLIVKDQILSGEKNEAQG